MWISYQPTGSKSSFLRLSKVSFLGWRFQFMFVGSNIWCQCQWFAVGFWVIVFLASLLRRNTSLTGSVLDLILFQENTSGQIGIGCWYCWWFRNPALQRGFYIHPNGCCLGFLNHQQYDLRLMDLNGRYFRLLSFDPPWHVKSSLSLGPQSTKKHIGKQKQKLRSSNNL